jgi:exosortase
MAWLWYVLVDDLRLEWSVNGQYAYGWAVPFLCAYLVWQKLKPAEGLGAPSSRLDPFRRSHGSVVLALLGLLAVAWLPVRLIQEANPQWRLSGWLLAGEVTGLTLLTLVVVQGGTFNVRRSTFNVPPSLLAQWAFPICFFLVAVPWPTVLEEPLVQGLARAITSATIELMNWRGIPAVQHGNTIELSTGLVGIDDACSGIRSFQATLMISLFFGQLYRLAWPRRLALVLAGFGCSCLFNLGRTFVLVQVAARQGLAALNRWHDPAGVTILVACFICLWLVGLLLKGKASPNGRASAGQDSAVSVPPAPATALAAFHPQAIPVLPFALLAVWVLLAEVGVETWYRAHERGLARAVVWSGQLPPNNPTARLVAIPEEQRSILRYDEGVKGSWEGAGGLNWQLVYLRWKPGRVAAHQAQGHVPESCLAAAGKEVTVLEAAHDLEVNGLKLPFRVYRVSDPERAFFVFHCVWQDHRRGPGGFEQQDISSRQGRLANVLAGRRNLGQRSLEIALEGTRDPAQALAALAAELPKLVRLETP